MREWMNTPLLLGKDTVVAKIKRFEKCLFKSFWFSERSVGIFMAYFTSIFILLMDAFVFPDFILNISLGRISPSIPFQYNSFPCMMSCL